MHISFDPHEMHAVPFDETLMLNTMRKQSSSAVSPIYSVTSISIAADNTIMWYDHHEDGYESDITDLANLQSTTEIWGDGDCSNGHAPETCGTTGNADELNAGTSINIIETIPIPRVVSNIFYDAGDKIASSFPVAISRGAYPTHADGRPFPELSGSSEVLNTENYGTEFFAPIGTDIASDNDNAFEETEFFILASTDGTLVTYTSSACDPTPCTTTINKGDTFRVSGVRTGDKVSANVDRPLQVHLITLNENHSPYVMRWFSMLPKSQWDNKYYTPVGDDNESSTTSSSCDDGNSVSSSFIYNPSGTKDITVNWSKGGTTSTACSGTCSGSFTVPKGEVVRHRMCDYNKVLTGYEYTTTNKADIFFGVAVIDTVNTQDWGYYDWGHTLIPESQLSSQVIIGDGRRCVDPTDTSACDGQNEGRNYVYVTPVADAKIWVSLNGETTYDTSYQAKRLSTLILGDDSDYDMSGAYIFATEPGAQPDGTPVDMAVVWGQLPYDSTSGQSQSVQLDMVSVPLPAR